MRAEASTRRRSGLLRPYHRGRFAPSDRRRIKTRSRAIPSSGATPMDRPDLDHLFSATYEELRRLARSVRSDHPAASLSPTTIVNEAYLKLAASLRIEPESRTHFKRLAARAMRQVLVEAARRRGGPTAGGGTGTASPSTRRCRWRPPPSRRSSFLDMAAGGAGPAEPPAGGHDGVPVLRRTQHRRDRRGAGGVRGHAEPGLAGPPGRGSRWNWPADGDRGDGPSTHGPLRMGADPGALPPGLPASPRGVAHLPGGGPSRGAGAGGEGAGAAGGGPPGGSHPGGRGGGTGPPGPPAALSGSPHGGSLPQSEGCWERGGWGWSTWRSARIWAPGWR